MSQLWTLYFWCHSQWEGKWACTSFTFLAFCSKDSILKENKIFLNQNKSFVTILQLLTDTYFHKPIVPYNNSEFVFTNINHWPTLIATSFEPEGNTEMVCVCLNFIQTQKVLLHTECSLSELFTVYKCKNKS